MRILLDNSVPTPLRHFLTAHVVVACVELNWERLKNGKLLAAAQEAGFDMFITCDQAMKSEQNWTGRRMAILALGSNLKARRTEIAARVNSAKPGDYDFMQFPESRKRKR